MTLWHGKTAELDTSIYAPALGALLDATMARVAARRLGAVTEADVLASVMSQRWDAPEFLALAAEDRAEFRDTAALVAARAAEGVRPADCLAAFDLVGEQVSREINPFERGAWRAPMPALIEALDDGATIPALLAALFAAASELPDGDLLTSLFDAPSLIDALRVASAKASAFEAGILDQAAVTPRALFAIERALALAAKAGRDKASGVDLLAAMISHKDTYAQLVLRRAGVAANTTAVSNWLGTMIDSPALPAAVPLEPGVESFAPDLADMLQAAVSSAAATGVPAAGERELLRGLLASTDPQVVYTIDNALSLPRPLLSDLLRQVPEPEVIEPYLPRDICPVRDLTGGSSEPVGRDSLTAAIVKVMFRKKTRNVLLHGERGVGASTMAQVLAAALRSGRFAALRHTHVIQFDLAGLPAGDYETAVDKVFAFMDAEPERIYVLEGFAPYFEENFERCARRLTHNEYRLILVVNTAEHTALTQGSQVLTDFLEVIEVPEPSAELTTQIVEAAATRVAGEYGVAFGPVAVATAIRQTRDYMLAHRFPAKAIELLERTAADVAADAEMTGSPAREVGRGELARRLAALTGLPEETILGTGADKDYVDLLSRNLVSQEVAVAKVAGRLDLIQKGMVDKHGPAAVFVFAGLSGTGKTELAKQIAQIYSSSRAIIHFAMENFTESHSVSGLIGSAPGLIGYDEGGALINAMNRDPYAVVLLDEVEKAHPAVWDPFLNLFDEGTITDTRGVTASGTKSFFVMTSNIGQYEIADMLAAGAAQEEIEDTVMKLLPSFVHPSARQPCFRPEFVGRIMRRGGVVAFNALSYEALLGIARHLFSKVAHDYGEVHESRLICDDDVLEEIARIIYEENAAVIRAHQPGYIGARRLTMLMDQYVTNKLAAKLRQLAGAALVRVVMDAGHSELVPVYDDADAEALLTERRLAVLARVERRWNAILTAPDDAFADLDEVQLARMDRLLSEVGAVL